MQSPFIDSPTTSGFTIPYEMEGSPFISTDPITLAKKIKRKFFIGTDSYNPQVQGLLDAIFPNAYLVNEQVDDQKAGLTWFTQNFSQLPATRIEPREIAMTFPGASRVSISSASLKFIGWDPHGLAAPATRPVIADVTYSYAARTSLLTDPTSLFPIAYFPTVVTYKGNIVDYCGNVYVPVGTNLLSNGVTEPSWVFDGTTNPVIPSAPWIISSNIRQLDGPIWEQEVVRYNGSFVFPLPP